MPSGGPHGQLRTCGKDTTCRTNEAGPVTPGPESSGFSGCWSLASILQRTTTVVFGLLSRNISSLVVSGTRSCKIQVKDFAKPHTIGARFHVILVFFLWCSTMI